jgi:FMN phosphatase YigB (HAD superfamily)
MKQTKQKQLTDYDLELIFKLERRDVIEINSWSRLYEEYKFSESFVEKHPKWIDWNLLCLFQELSPEFIARNIDKITANILLNPYYENYPDSLKLLLETKFRSQLEETRQQQSESKLSLVEFFETYPGFVLSLVWIVTFVLTAVLKVIYPLK